MLFTQEMLHVLILVSLPVGHWAATAGDRGTYERRGGGGGGRGEGGNSRSSAACNWDTLNLAQAWPPAVCIRDAIPECKIPSDIKSWVIHGLWPTKGHTAKPEYCHRSWKFDLAEVRNLTGELTTEWPDENFRKKPELSWSHEWDRHGTCATCLPELSSEFRYFNVTLALHRKYNLRTLIPPSDEALSLEDVMETLTKGIGARPKMTCTWDKKTQKSYLEQVEVCLTKAFSPVDCDQHGPPTVSAHAPKPGSSLRFRSEKLPPASETDDWEKANYGRCDEKIFYQPF